MIRSIACALKDRLRIRLKNDALAGTEATNIDLRMISLGQLPQKIMFIRLRLEVDIMLRAAQAP